MLKRSTQRLYLPLLVLALTLSACASNPLQYAATVLDKAHVALKSLEILQTEVLALVSDPAIPASAKATLKTVSHNATLAAEQAGDAVIEVEAARAQLKVGETTSDRLAIANANLVTWTNTINDRIAAIKKAQTEARNHA